MVFWVMSLTIIVVIEGFIIRDCIERLDTFESWYPFCELMKMRISKDKGGEDK